MKGLLLLAFVVAVVVTQNNATDNNEKPPSDLEKHMTGRQYHGRWKTTDAVSLRYFTGFGTAEGLTMVSFKRAVALSHSVSNVSLTILEDRYINGKVLILTIPIEGKFDSDCSCWHGTTNSTAVMLYRNQYVDSAEMATKFNITKDSLQIDSLALRIKANLEEGWLHSLSSFVLIIPNILFMLLIRFGMAKQVIDPARVSALSLNFVLSFTLLVLLIELMLGLLEEASDWFMLTATVTFISFMYLTHYSFSKCKVLHQRSIQWTFIISTAYVVLLLFAFDKPYAFLVNSLWLMPQIILNAYLGGRPPFYPCFYAIVSFNQIYVVYLLGCPANIYLLEPRYAELMALLCCIVFQWIVLYQQSIQGGRFFVPNVFIPGYHEYIVRVKRDKPPATEICSICNEVLQHEHSLFPSDTLPILSTSRVTIDNESQVSLMVTPCKHYFHIHCLSKWMENKHICPLDRAALPPIE